MAQYCMVDGCGKPRRARGWCKAHYRRWQRHGDPLFGKPQLTPHDEILDYFYGWLGHETEECLIWPYARSASGYGKVRIDGITKMVHILACEHQWGPAPRLGMQAAHGPCHNRACWNGRHVSWKTVKENLADKLRDGTDMRGEKHFRTKFTSEDIRRIRHAAELGVRQSYLAKKYGVSQPTINDIVCRRTWKHI